MELIFWANGALLHTTRAPVTVSAAMVITPRSLRRSIMARVVLSPITMAGKLELYFLTLEPGAVLASEAHEPGSCELITVISGEVEIEAGRNSAKLESGDVLNYQCDTSHRISNPGRNAATLHMVVNFKGASM